MQYNMRLWREGAAAVQHVVMGGEQLQYNM